MILPMKGIGHGTEKMKEMEPSFGMGMSLMAMVKLMFFLIIGAKMKMDNRNLMIF